MTQKIFRSILFVSLLFLVASFAGLGTIFYRSWSRSLLESLQVQAQMILELAENLDHPTMEKLDSDSYRLSWISADGQVLYDSLDSFESLDNHLLRPEIQMAKEKGSGQSIRYSDTLAEQTYNVALLQHDGSYIRVSVTMDSMWGSLLQFIWPILALFALGVILAWWLAWRISNSIVQPILSINLDDPLKTEIYPQLEPLLSRIALSNARIDKQMNDLRQKNAQLDVIAHNMEEGLILFNANLDILLCNESAIRLFHIDKTWKALDHAQIAKALKKAEKKGRAYFELEQNERWYEVSLASVLLDDAGKPASSGSLKTAPNPQKPSGYVLVAVDETEKKEASRKRREFSANVTHELKTPIHTILSSIELLQTGLVKEEDKGRFYSYIDQEGHRLLELVNGVLRLSRLDEEMEDHPEVLDLSDLAAEVLQESRVQAHQAGIALRYDLNRVSFVGSRRAWMELMSNLIENAIKYNKEGGSVFVELFERNDQVIFSVSDSGIGMDPALQERIFERFYRIDTSHSQKIAGSGLGLAIVKQSVLAMKGSISVQSKPDQGTTIRVEIPIPMLGQGNPESEKGTLQ